MSIRKRFSTSRQLFKSSYNVLKLDKELVLFPFIESVIIILVVAAMFIASIAIHGLSMGAISNWSNEGVAVNNWEVYAAVGILVVFATFISNLFAGAVINAAFERFDGGDPSVRGSLSRAWSKKKSIFLFSILASFVGLILDAIRQRVPFGGKLLTWLGEVAWAVASFFALAVIIRNDEVTGPLDATKQSMNLIKKVWGESLIISGTIGLISVVIILSYVLISFPIMIAVVALSAWAGLGVGILLIIGLFVISLVLSALSSIAKAAIYYWAVTGKAPQQFNSELLRSAITPKKARKIFSS